MHTTLISTLRRVHYTDTIPTAQEMSNPIQLARPPSPPSSHNTPPPSDFPSASPASKTKSKPLLYTFLHASPPVLLGLVNGLSDDLYTASRLGLISKRAGERAGYYADWCWFLSTLVGLVENGVERSVILEQQHQGASLLTLN